MTDVFKQIKYYVLFTLLIFFSSVSMGAGSDDEGVSGSKTEVKQQDNDAICSGRCSAVAELSSSAAGSSLEAASSNYCQVSHQYDLEPSTSSGSMPKHQLLMDVSNELKKMEPWLVNYYEECFQEHLLDKSIRDKSTTLEEYVVRLKEAQLNLNETKNITGTIPLNTSDFVGIPLVKTARAVRKKRNFQYRQAKVKLKKAKKMLAVKPLSVGSSRSQSVLSLKKMSQKVADQVNYSSETVGCSGSEDMYLDTMALGGNDSDNSDSEDADQFLSELMEIITKNVFYDEVPCSLEFMVPDGINFLRVYNSCRTTDPDEDEKAFLKAKEKAIKNKLNGGGVISNEGFGFDRLSDELDLLRLEDQVITVLNDIHLFSVVFYLFDADRVENELVESLTSEYSAIQDTEETEFYFRLQAEKAVGQVNNEKNFLIGIMVNKQYQWIRMTDDILVNKFLPNLMKYKLAGSYRLTFHGEEYRDDQTVSSE